MQQTETYMVEQTLASGDTGIKSPEAILRWLGASKSKPRLLFFAVSWMYGGVERGLSSILPELSEHFDIFLLTLPKDEENHFSLPQRITHLEIESWTNLPQKVASICSLLQIDVMVGCCNCSNITEELYEKVHNLFRSDDYCIVYNLSPNIDK